MGKSPIEYFEEQVFDSHISNWDVSVEEQRFLQKYVGLDYDMATLLSAVTLLKEKENSLVLQIMPEAEEEAKAQTESWDRYLRDATESLLMGFHLGECVYAVPALAIQEVTRAISPTALPMASPAVVGVVNFRSRVTPLVHLSTLMAMEKYGKHFPLKQGIAETAERSSGEFCIICQASGLQFGLLVERIDTLYNASSESLKWEVDALAGVDAGCIAALHIEDSAIIPVLSLDRVVAAILQP